MLRGYVRVRVVGDFCVGMREFCVSMRGHPAWYAWYAWFCDSVWCCVKLHDAT